MLQDKASIVPHSENENTHLVKRETGSLFQDEAFLLTVAVTQLAFRFFLLATAYSWSILRSACSVTPTCSLLFCCKTGLFC